MNRIIAGIILLLIGFSKPLAAQNKGVIAGTVIDKSNQLPLYGVSIKVENTEFGTVTDSLGRFRIMNIDTRSYNILFTRVGYKSYTIFNVVLTSGNELNFSIELEPEIKSIGEITVTGRRTAKVATLETPLSVQRLTTEEIKANPGGNFDISRVINTLPGVGGTAGSVGGFRNDIIIRGGGPGENVFYLDGIEIPVINHFATQGSGGGPTGILNVSFIEDVKLSSSAFDARYDNALSSVFEFKQKKGSSSHVQGNVRLSATELAATLEGPLSKSKKTTFLASARRSYLQFLFKAIDLPIRPNYWDFQYKVTHQINKKTTLTFLGVGAIDEFSFAAPSESTPEKIYILNSNPNINQWNYTVGAALKRNIKNGYMNFALSRNAFNNGITRFEDNLNPKPSQQSLDLNSNETENKFRFDVNQTVGGWKLSYGAVVQYVQFSNNGFARIRAEVRDTNNNIIQPEIKSTFNSSINFARLGAFAQAGKRFFDNRLGVNFGIRMDGNTFTDKGMNLFHSFSPRIGLSYVLSDEWTVNASIGRYYKLAPYTILGFENNAGNLVNKDAKYQRSDHYVIGLEFLPKNTTRFTIEGFYKQYGNMPVSVRDGVNLANRGGDFNVLGNEDVISTGKGRTYGVELFAQQKLTKRFYGVFSYTLFVSQFSGADNKYVSSAWDNRHLLSVTWGYKFSRNWELGLKFRFQGGAPYTPFDETASRQNYLSLGEGVLDNAKLNQNRLDVFHASDVRIDKKWNWKKMTLDVFLDVSNWYLAKSPAFPQYTFKRTADNSAFASTNNKPVAFDGSNAIPLILQNNDPSVTPTIGFILEF
ncbi:MAG: TonB-dependent receptor [Chitinophagaceae bacterium]|nr:TonB-dependent receptor [Chitinophagaceae bacterium]